MTSLSPPVPAEMLLVDTISELRATSPALAVALRQQLSDVIWQAPTPAAFPVVPLPWSTGAGQSLESTTARVAVTRQWLASYMSRNVTARSIYVTFPGATRLMIVAGGHGVGFLQPNEFGLPTTTWMPPGVQSLIRRLAAEAACDLLLVSMPMQGENRYFAPYVGIDPNGWVHDELGTRPDLRPPQGSPLRYFTDPVIGSLDHILSLRSYDRIGIAGLSGGGWTATVIAALDERVQRSYAVAGSVPMKFRNPAVAREGDWEQYAPEMLAVVDYSDLYLMGATGAGRKAFVLHNSADANCFPTAHVAPYARELTRFARDNGFSPLRFHSSRASVHDIQPDMVNLIVADFVAAD